MLARRGDSRPQDAPYYTPHYTPQRTPHPARLTRYLVITPPQAIATAKMLVDIHAKHQGDIQKRSPSPASNPDPNPNPNLCLT